MLNAMVRLPILLALLFSAALAAEQVYRIERPDGSVEFTDEPSPQAEPIQVQPVPTYPAPQSPAARMPAPNQSTERVQTGIAITRPNPGETFWVIEWQVPAAVAVQPAMKPGQQVQLVLDGQVIAQGGAREYILDPVYRGEHQLYARLLDAAGRELVRSEPVVFYVHKHTIKRP